MADRQVKFDLHLVNDFGLPGNARNIAGMLYGDVDGQPVRELATRGIYYAEQILDEISSLKSWNEVRTKRRDPKASLTGPESFTNVVSGRVDGYASSTKAELVGQYATILVSPRNAPAAVYIDNMAVVVQFQGLAQKRETSTEWQRLRFKYVVWCVATSRVFFKQGGKVTVKWVKGHA
ncbi:hypothetical protein BX616_003912 [Lobosporangium transversale]|nr:hypothetical protein BX616_003912 [Lobosporangium transversale]